LNDFYNEVSNNAYRIWFEKVSEDYIKEKNLSGELFLFQIYNQDFGEKSTGTKNLHTMYFKELFSNSNIGNNFPFKLNGEAELFYRPKTKDLEKKNIVTKGKSVKLEKGEKAFEKNRYTENKVFFHVPITLNRTPKGIFRFNLEINNFLANNPEINIIGIDRGEKHLAYYSVINQAGRVLESGSLNTINKVDYHKKLEARAGEREQARKDWQDVEGIKDLKKGYISQVVRKLADLAIEHNAIIVMEDLNMRFKQIRGGVEKSTYQQLEKALIEKLNFLVNKGEADPMKAGHLLRAYQLTAPFEAFKDMGKQTGIIFYTQASYTSKIDPLTGWRPNLYLKYSNAKKTKEDILKFKSIEYRSKENRFELTYDIKDFSDMKEFPRKTEWSVCSNVERFRWDRKRNDNKGGYIHYGNLTEELKSLFGEFEINLNTDIKEQIKKIDVEKKENAKFFRDFVYCFSLICQIRNTQQDKEGNENDFIQSPIEPFFDSRRSKDFGQDLPKNGDDNGAYNIARKGIIILDKISRYHSINKTTEKLSWGDLFISSSDWDNFATNQK
jgi:CRISPR-associated protein Cpf1